MTNWCALGQHDWYPVHGGECCAKCGLCHGVSTPNQEKKMAETFCNVGGDDPMCVSCRRPKSEHKGVLDNGYLRGRCPDIVRYFTPCTWQW